MDKWILVIGPSAIHFSGFDCTAKQAVMVLACGAEGDDWVIKCTEYEVEGTTPRGSTITVHAAKYPSPGSAIDAILLTFVVFNSCKGLGASIKYQFCFEYA